MRVSPSLTTLAGWLFAFGVPLWLGWLGFNHSYADWLTEAQLTVDTARLVLDDAKEPPPPDRGVPVVLPHDWSKATPVAALAWYTAELELNVPPNRLWGIYLPNVNMNAAVYLNGELLGQGGVFAEPARRLWHQPLYFAIPSGLLRPGGNLLQIRLHTDPPRNGWLGRLHLGPASALRPTFERDYFFRNSLVKLITSALLFTSLATGLLWLLRRQDTLYGWYALAALNWGLHTSNLFVVNIPMPTRWWDALINYGTLGGFTICLIIFIHRYLEIHRPGVERALLAYGGFGALALLLVPAPWFYELAIFGWDASLLLLGLYPSYLILWAYWTRRGGVDLLLVTSGLCIMAFALHDWLTIAGMTAQRGEGLFIQYAAPAPLLGFGWLLLRDFVRARNEAEALNRDLEQRVREKSAELERNYQRLRELERQRVLDEERRRIMRDMHDGMGGHLISTLALTESGAAQSATIAEALRAALNDLRLMIDSLDPVEGDLTLVLGMFRARLESQLTGSGLQLVWRVDDVPPLDDFGPSKVLQVLRILQEAITNALKHARARTLTVRTGVAGPRAYIEVTDDGRGFGPGGSTGRGLDHMRQRARAVGGELTLDNGADGVRVCLWLPLAAPESLPSA
jgi:signal transduction histidine kinase